jgi:hypothetical protein
MTHFRWLRLWPAALLVVAGCSSGTPKTSVGATTTTTTANANTTSTTSTTTAGTPPPTTTVSAGGPLPTGFTVTDLTWVSDTQGWALGTAPCAQAPCTSVVHTLDGGQTWAGLPAPKAYLDRDPVVSGTPPCSATVACVDGIRFANATTGYAFGISSLWLTTDGGHTWTERSTTPTDALEVDGDMVVRITHSSTESPPGIPYQMQATTVGSTTWHALPAPALNGDGAELAVQGPNLYEAIVQNPAGGADDEHPLFARSTDSGAQWSSFADPCGVTPSGNEADATAISAAPGGVLAVGCTARTSGEAGFAVVSADAGAIFGPHKGNLLSSVAPDEYVAQISAATGQRLAVLVVDTASSTGEITVSNDAGDDWTVTQTSPSAGGADGMGSLFLGFEDATTGRAVIMPNTVLTTTDGGGHWAPFVFP